MYNYVLCIYKLCCVIVLQYHISYYHIILQILLHYAKNNCRLNFGELTGKQDVPGALSQGGAF